MPAEWAKTRALNYLCSHPCALEDGSPGPRSISRLVNELLARGAVRVQPPRCPKCAGPKPLEYRNSGQYICRSCYTNKVNVASCGQCQRVRPIGARRGSDVICTSCIHQDPSKREICSRCQTLAPVSGRDAGASICQLCLDRPERRCDDCGEMRVIHSNKGGQSVCKWCYRKRRNGITNLRTRLPKRPMRRRQCFSCGDYRLCVDYTTEKPLCVRCAEPLIRTCVICLRERRTHAVWPIGPVCVSCWEGHEGRCETCGGADLRVVVLRGALHCLRCVGSGGISNCLRCGRAGRPFRDKICAPCCTEIEFDHIGLTRNSTLYPLRTLLVSQHGARGLLMWLRRSPAVPLIAGFAARNEVPSHDFLDSVDHHKAALIRSALIAAKLLPERVESVGRVERWLQQYLRSADQDHLPLLVAFGKWHVLRRLRSLCEHRGETAGAAAGARARIRAAGHFLRWLATVGRTLSTCRQEDLDQWLVSSKTTGYDVKYFVRWATTRRRCQQLVMPNAKGAAPTAPSDESGRWAIVERLLTDEKIDRTDRIAGLFLLLYAQPMTRIRRLSDADVTESEGEVLVRFGSDWTPLCPVLDDLVRSLIQDYRLVPRSRTTAGATLLFPSPVQYGRPVGATALSRKLRRLGINVVADRLSIETELLRRIKIPRIIADMIGIHIGTAVRKAVELNVSASQYAVKNVRHGT